MRLFSKQKSHKHKLFSRILKFDAYFCNMDELINIADDNGWPGHKTILKSEAHKTGVFHATIHVWFYTKPGEILIQQRAFDKDTFPGLWDVSVAGHIAAGEKVDTGAIRETEEEIGLRITKYDLHKVGIYKSTQRHSSTFIDCEFHHIFLAELPVDLDELKKQAAEVADLKLVSLVILENELSLENLNPNKYVSHDTTYYNIIFSALKSRIKNIP